MCEIERQHLGIKGIAQNIVHSELMIHGLHKLLGGHSLVIHYQRLYMYTFVCCLLSLISAALDPVLILLTATL